MGHSPQGPCTAFPGKPHPSTPGAIAVAAGTSSPSYGKAAGTGFSLCVAVPACSHPCERGWLFPHSAQGAAPSPSDTRSSSFPVSLAWLAVTGIMEVLVPQPSHCIQKVHPHLLAPVPKCAPTPCAENAAGTQGPKHFPTSLL